MRDIRASSQPVPESSANRRHMRRDIGMIMLCALAYFAAHHIAFIFPDSEKVLMAVWPVGGIGLAALLLNERRLWPYILIAFFIAGNTANLIVGRPLAASLGFMTANVLESLLSALLITEFSRTVVRFDRVVHIVLLTVAAVFVNGATAFIGAGTAALTSKASFWMFWRTWWIADGLGILIITPIIVVLADVKYFVRSIRLLRALEFLLFIGLWCLFSYVLFNLSNLAHAYYLQPYMLTALIVWPALRFGVAGVSAASILLAAIMITSTAVQTGPLTWGGENIEARLLQSQVFVSLCSFAGYLLAASFMQLRISEAKVRQSDERWRFAAESTGFGVYEYEFSGNLAHYSPEFLALYGLAAGDTLELDERLLPKVLYPDDRESFFTAMTSANDPRGDGILDIEYRIFQPDGSIRWLRARGRTTFSPDGKPVRANGIIQDITGRKQAENVLKKTRDLLRQTEQMGNVGGWELNIDTGEQTWTEAVYDIHEVDADFKPTVENGLAFYTPESKPIIEHAVQRAIDHGEPFDMELNIITAKGNLRWVHAIGKSDLQNRRVFGFFQDISERKKTEAALLQADKMSTLGILATGIAHEVNQPLMAISMALDNILLRHDMEYTTAKVTDMKQYLRRITAIIDSIRTFAREQKENRATAFSINASIRNVIDMLGAQYRSHGIALHTALDDSLPQIRGDIYRFEQVVINLLTNAHYAVEQRASKAGPDYRREIAVETAGAGNDVLLRVRDNGIGMSDDVQRKLFAPFFTTKPTGEGMGMGLSISFGIVKSMDGTISVESVPDSHTVFTVSLPIQRSGGDA